MKYYKSLSSNIFDTLNIVFLTILIVITLYPCIYVFSASFSDQFLMNQGGKILLFPRGFTLINYVAAFQNPMLVRSFLNTLLYVTTGTAVNLIMTSFGAFALSKRFLPGSVVIMKLVVFSMLFSGGLIPSYILVMKLGMIDKIWALIIPTSVNAMYLIIMRTYFQGIEPAIEESAKLDGANDFTVLFRIILPISLPVVCVIILFYAVAHWNDYFQPMIYLRSREKYPLQLVLKEILTGVESKSISGLFDESGYLSDNIKYSVIVISSAPIMCFYPFLQKYFIKGIMIGSIK